MDKNELALARQEINAVDEEMAELFVRRMRAVERVAAYKAQHGLPILDEAREAEVVAKNAARVEDEELRSLYVQYLNDNMRLSRRYQERLIAGMKVAFCGVEGAFAAIAAKKIFPQAARVPYHDFRAAYDAVVNGECECAYHLCGFLIKFRLCNERVRKIHIFQQECRKLQQKQSQLCRKRSKDSNDRLDLV